MRHTIAFTTSGARDKIIVGRKWQTLRLAERRGDIKIGDELVLKEWIGRPRRRGSRLRGIAAVRCTQAVGPYVFRLEREGCPVYIREPEAFALVKLSLQTRAALALADGYDTWGDLVRVLRGFYGRRPMELVGIRWRPLSGSADNLALSEQEENP